MSLEEEICRLANGGLVTGRPPDLLGSQESPDLDNIDPADPLGATTRPGSSVFSSAVATAASGYRGAWLGHWTRSAGTTYQFAQFGTIIYSVDSSGSALSVKTGVATDSFGQAAFLNNLAVVVASGIAPQVSTAGSSLANLGGTPPSLAKYAAVYMAKMWLAGDTSNPTQIYFSKSNDPEDYTTANNAGNIIIANAGDIIQGLEGTKGALYAFMRRSTYIITGSSPFDFNVGLLCSWGVVSEWGHATDGNGAFFASDEGIYYTSGFNLARISDDVRDTYVSISDKSTITMEVKGEKLFVFYKSSSSATQNDKALVLAFKRTTSTGEIRGVWSSYSTQPFQAARTSRANDLYVLTTASTAQIYKIDTGTSGTTSAYWNTPDLDFDEPDAMKTLMRYFVHVKPPNSTTALTVQWYADGASLASAYSLSVGTSGSHVYFQQAPKIGTTITGRRLRAKFSWTGQMTFYGWRIFADVRTDEIPRR